MKKTKVESHVDRVMNALRAGVGNAMEEIGTNLERDARRNLQSMVYSTPEPKGRPRTGALMRSLGHTTDEMSTEVAADIDYAVYVHEGTQSTSPKPFLVDALKESHEYLGAVVTEHLKKEGLR